MRHVEYVMFSMLWLAAWVESPAQLALAQRRYATRTALYWKALAAGAATCMVVFAVRDLIVYLLR